MVQVGILLEKLSTPLEIKCLKIKVIDGYVNKKIHESPPGTILTIDNTIIVACGNKTSFSITQIQKPGKRQLDTKTFLKGFSIKEGDFFDWKAGKY